MNKKRMFYLDPPKILVLGFSFIILIGAFLLTLPAATVDGKGLPWLDALFTATSATCVTGLVVVDTGTTFTLFGQLVILALIQIGGLGFMAFATLFALILGKRISLKERLLIKESLNNLSIDGVVRLVKRILIFTAVIELIGGILLAIRFSFDMPLPKAIYFGFFHAISNFNNAGFDLMGDFRSLTGYVDDPLVTLVVCTLITLGGIGFIVMNEVYEYRQTRRFSLHTKIVFVMSSILVVFGTILIFILEYHNPKTLQPLSPLGKFLASLYQAVTPRTAGSNTLNIPDLTQPTLFLIIFLMFIGASPGSTGGGIKTTTFATLLGAVWSNIKGKEDVIFFRNRILYDTIYKALTVTVSGLFVVMMITMLLTITEPNKDFLMILFEATSAFATVGLSMGLTPELSPVGKILIILTMFAGRVGPLTIAYAVTLHRKPDPFKFPKGKIMIG
ncbi:MULTISPECIES: TrkH family potassium uptake protein [unclassified Geobacillus]|uniref:Potassium uptake protein, TrkH family n=1 Tax=Geobacillus sp. (strain WCH70) TaxID=471223 RepID=C5D5C4_GEOSW|nr:MULTISPECIES: TrkH family potassium uptake protein [unclassified Geobacillus]PDM39792.1 Trk family potassium uptake protein [Parageobacillus yumthangensis]PUF88406.1 Trk family potassium uptake protein [Geobacillus sp. LYN3]RDV21100.1 Trk family potassium uptake protein [Parageobacillus toebii]TXK88090.1 Trk family potassium uptake protein [Geobacillus sp. AYS3]